MFSLLRRFIEFVRQLQKEPEEVSITSLLFRAIWAVGTKIDLEPDILGWINDNLEDLLHNGATEVNIIRGKSLTDFIIDNQRRHKYLEISNNDLKALRDGVVLVVMDSHSHIINEQLIRSKEGLSSEMTNLFHGEAIMKIKLPNENMN